MRKQRGVVRASIPRLGTRLRELKKTPNQPGVSDHSKQLATRLKLLDADFKTVHLQIVHVIEEEATALETEQDALDRHDDESTGLTIRLQKIIA